MIRGHFIVFEGIDGSGTTTQAALLQERFEQLGLPAHVTAEPSSGPVGTQIRQILSGRLVVPRSGSQSSFDWQTMALLFAADRHDHVRAEIEPNMIDGVNVICDRYLYSSVIYQSTASDREDAVPWVKSLNRFVRTPDLVFFLKVDAEVAIKRCRARDRSAEIYEEPEFQRRLAVQYEQMPTTFPDHNIVVIDGEQTPEAIADQCWDRVQELRAKGAPV